MRRPFESRDEVKRGGKVISLRITSFGRFETGGGDAAAATTEVPPDVPAVDVRLQPVLAEAEAKGLLRRGGVKTVAGRRCQVWRSAESLATGPIERKPTARSHVASCVDEAGLVLEEVAVRDGKAAPATVAVTVEEEPALDDGLFRTGDDPLPVLQGGGSVLELRPGSRPPGEFFEPGPPPEAFTLVGRYTVVPPQGPNFSDPQLRNQRIAGIADIFTRGADVLVVEQGATLGGTDPYPVGGDVTTPAGAGRVVLSARRNELDVGRKGAYVRIYGTVPTAQLIEVAARLQPVPGGTLEFVDPEAQRRASGSG